MYAEPSAPLSTPRATLRRDVVVVGAGPAGSATAALLAEAGQQVLLLDRATFPRAKACAEYCSPGTESLLARLGVLVGARGGPGRHLAGMELVAPGGERFLLEYRQNGRAMSGLALPRLELDAALVESARARGAEVRLGLQVTSLHKHAGGYAVLGRDRRGQVMEVLARLIVGADGLHSTVTRWLGVRGRGRWPRSLGLVVHYHGVPWPEDFGRMYVGRRGYVGVAPTGDGLLVVGLVMPMPSGRLGLPELAFHRALEGYPELAERLSGGRRLGPVRGVGPMSYSVRSCAGASYVLVGDAAGFFDPFAGEGIYRALRSAELAAEVADEALRAGDLSHRRLRRYEALRAREFGPKERLSKLVQLFVQVPGLMDYAVARLRRRSELAGQLSLALGDLLPANQVLRPGALWALLRP